jgi:hypothetical protein
MKIDVRTLLIPGSLFFFLPLFLPMRFLGDFFFDFFFFLPFFNFFDFFLRLNNDDVDGIYVLYIDIRFFFIIYS